jgi:hypothetical protein
MRLWRLSGAVAFSGRGQSAAMAPRHRRLNQLGVAVGRLAGLEEEPHAPRLRLSRFRANSRSLHRHARHKDGEPHAFAPPTGCCPRAVPSASRAGGRNRRHCPERAVVSQYDRPSEASCRRPLGRALQERRPTACGSDRRRDEPGIQGNAGYFRCAFICLLLVALMRRPPPLTFLTLTDDGRQRSARAVIRPLATIYRTFPDLTRPPPGAGALW